MVASMHMRLSHCLAMIPAEVFAVLFGRYILLVTLPSSIAVLLRDPKGYSCSFAGSWLQGLLPSDPIIVGDALSIARTQHDTELLSLYIATFRFGQQFAGALLYCIFIFHGAQFLGRFASIVLAAVGTTMAYQFGLMNPAWGSVNGLLACTRLGFWLKAAGGLAGGAVAGLVYHIMDSEMHAKERHSPKERQRDQLELDQLDL
eukprot:gnl/MRDRNA2_/MRDRNA2_62715_c0_seq1.p1 gnl/MRDRNA2_/MRDRNA2_62715_c0~~gnl/MRDRNA2_/MRDRNA2_62715_c0_seq1.p1  ORF type:complete len:236 (+),score=36.27 gnl/MRDRNA2_/MRDRNA2_62715_c0_seq1:102-710(+)